MTALSIVLGVGFVAGTFVLTDTMNKAFSDLFTQASSGSDVIVRAESAFAPSQAGPGGGGGDERDPIPESVLTTVQAISGVKTAVGSVVGYAQMIDPATGDAISGVGPPTLGVNWSDTSTALTLRQGSEPSGPDEVAVDAATAKEYDLSPGDTIRILFEGPPRGFTISGIAGFGDADNLAGATLAAFDTPTAQEVLGKEGQYDQIDVVADDGVSVAELQSRIRSALPKNVEAVKASDVADEQAKQLQDALGFFRTALLVFAFIALFVGAFIIFNTFSIIVAQRTREMALLRAIGASRRQVLTSVVVEAFVTGLVASALGFLAGIGIAVGLQGLLAAFGVDLPSTATQLHLRTVVVAFVVGTGVTVVSSILPARRAARVAPVEALRESADSASGSLRRRLIVGLVLTGAAVAALLYGLFGNRSNAGVLIGLGAAATFVGIAILLPLASRPFAGVIGAPIRRMGIQGKLGRENAMRNPRRTASTASALMIGLGLVAMVTVLASSLKASIDVAIEKALKADLVLTTSSATPFSPDIANRVLDVEGVSAVSEFRQGGFRVHGSTSFITGIDPATIDRVATLDLSPEAIHGLQAGKIVVFDDVVKDEGWKVGDTVPAEFATVGKVPLEIGGTFGENSLIGGNYVISLDAYEKYFQQQLDAFVMLKLQPGADVKAVTASVVVATKEFGNVEVQDQTAFRDQQAGFIDQLLGLITALLAMAILIALFGIVNTLGLSIFERTRELGLLRAVGMSRRQVKRMIRWESVIIAIMGALLGVAIGVFFGYALQQALANQGVTELVIPTGQLMVYVVFAALAGVLAAFWPARRAAKLNVLEAISYE
ncbi:MAG: ABC transporter permease [Actinomycetota bacterium]